MRMTYRQMVQIMNEVFTEDQWESDVTVEDGIEEECYAAELRICGDNHDSLDEDHPVIFIPREIVERATDQDIYEYIKEMKNEKPDDFYDAYTY